MSATLMYTYLYQVKYYVVFIKTNHLKYAKSKVKHYGTSCVYITAYAIILPVTELSVPIFQFSDDFNGKNGDVLIVQS